MSHIIQSSVKIGRSSLEGCCCSVQSFSYQMYIKFFLHNNPHYSTLLAFASVSWSSHGEKIFNVCMLHIEHTVEPSEWMKGNGQSSASSFKLEISFSDKFIFLPPTDYHSPCKRIRFSCTHNRNSENPKSGAAIMYTHDRKEKNPITKFRHSQDWVDHKYLISIIG